MSRPNELHDRDRDTATLSDRTYLGEFETLVILACLQIGPTAYPVSIRREIEKRTGRSVSRGTIYVTLERLEQKGLLRSKRSTPLPERGGKARRLFEVLPSGLVELKRARVAYLAMSDGLSQLDEA